MKELSIEEKANAYDKVREKIALRFGSNVAEEIFSEFEMSEDEKIRIGLIENFKFFGGDYLETSKWGKDDDLLVTDIIAWLEKQGESKSANKDKELTCKDIEIILGIENNILHECNDNSQLVIEVYPKGENYYGEILRRFNNQRIKPQRMISAEAKEAMYGKPAWSEENEVRINRIVACLENLNVADNDILLKDVGWLKSLRPQNRWKPSEEQLRFLQHYADQNNYGGTVLTSLLNDLKKLREE